MLSQRHLKKLPTKVSEAILLPAQIFPLHLIGFTQHFDVAVSVNLTIYDPTIVTNIVRWSGNDKFGAPSLFLFPIHLPPYLHSVVDTNSQTI